MKNTSLLTWLILTIFAAVTYADWYDMKLDLFELNQKYNSLRSQCDLRLYDLPDHF